MSLLTRFRCSGPLRSLGAAAALIAASLFVASPTTLMAQEQAQPKAAGTAGAAADEPVVVVALGSIQRLMQDVNYISGVIDQAQLGGMFSMMAATFTQGIEQNKPIGVLISLEEGMPAITGVIPTQDAKGVLKRLEAQTGPADELDDGTMVIAFGATTIYVKQQGDWAVVAGDRDHLDSAPADPLPLLEDLGKEYLVAARVRPQLVPDDLRGLLIDQIRQGFEQATAAQVETPESARELAENSIEQLEMIINETEEMTFGVKVDQSAKQLAIDMTVTGKPGSALAELYASQQAVPSQFASVVRDDAIVYAHYATSIGPKAVEQAKGSMQMMLKTMDEAIGQQDGISYEIQTEISAYLERIGGLVIDSMSEGRADMGMALVPSDGGVGFVAGAFVADGNEVAKIVKEIAGKVEYEPGAPTFKFDTENYNGISIHVVEADIPASINEARQVFGESVTLYLGTGDNSVYAAVGNGAQDLMKNLIDSGKKDTPGDRPIGQARVKLLPVLEFLQNIQENESITTMVDALSGSDDPGVVGVVATEIENGQAFKVTLSEGVLKALVGAVLANQELGF